MFGMGFIEDVRNNASTIEHEIESLRNNHCDADLLGYRSHYRYRDFWTHAKQITEMFKTLKPLLREDRERLWSSYRDICDNVKGRQNEDRGESSKNKELTESLITDAYRQADGAANKEGLDKAKSMQTYNLELMKERKLFREDRDALWKYWKETNEKIFWKRHELQESDFLHGKQYHVDRAVNTAHYGDPYEALREIKEAQENLRGLYLNKEQRNELYNSLNDAWEKASSRIGEIKGEKRRKREEWQERMEGNIERWENSIQKAEHFISSLENQIDKLRNEEDKSRTDEYAERVRGWIYEKEEKISEVREQIRELEGKIDSVKGKIRS